jgi:hypothetical protein
MRVGRAATRVRLRSSDRRRPECPPRISGRRYTRTNRSTPPVSRVADHDCSIRSSASARASSSPRNHTSAPRLPRSTSLPAARPRSHVCLRLPPPRLLEVETPPHPSARFSAPPACPPANPAAAQDGSGSAGDRAADACLHPPRGGPSRVPGHASRGRLDLAGRPPPHRYRSWR